MKSKIEVAKNRFKALLNPISVERNYNILIEGYMNNRVDQRNISSSSLIISEKIREFFLK